MMLQMGACGVTWDCGLSTLRSGAVGGVAVMMGALLGEMACGEYLLLSSMTVGGCVLGSSGAVFEARYMKALASVWRDCSRPSGLGGLIHLLFCVRASVRSAVAVTISTSIGGNGMVK